MSVAANIAVLILIAGAIVFLLATMVLLVLTGIALVEVTVLIRRFLRGQGQRTNNLTQNIDTVTQNIDKLIKLNNLMYHK